MSLPRYLILFICLLLSGALSIASASENEINLAVANSTCKAIKELGQLFEQRNGVTINYLCKSSGRLAKGLKGEAITADIFISASKKWMDFMLAEELAQPVDVISPWGNKLVVAIPANSELELENWSDLASDRVGTILIGDPGTAPFGRYTKQAMEETGLWEQVIHKLVTKKHITLLAEALEEADTSTVGILFVSNVTSGHNMVFSVDDSWHSPIRYYAAPIKGAVSKDSVVDMMKFLQGNEVSEIFTNAGFKVFAH